TALILQRLLPDAELVLIDASAENLEIARRFLNSRVRFLHAFYDPACPASQAGLGEVDLLAVPLAFVGDRSVVYDAPPAPRVIVHDWLWRATAKSRLVSVLLLKRINLITSTTAVERLNGSTLELPSAFHLPLARG